MPHGCAEKVFKNQINALKSYTTWQMNSIEDQLCASLTHPSIKLMESYSYNLKMPKPDLVFLIVVILIILRPV